MNFKIAYFSCIFILAIFGVCVSFYGIIAINHANFDADNNTLYSETQRLAEVDTASEVFYFGATMMALALMLYLIPLYFSLRKKAGKGSFLSFGGLSE